MKIRSKMLMISIVSVALGVTAINSQAHAFTQTRVVHEADSVSFKVYGKCGMCKNRIQGAAIKLEGVESANWDAASKILSIRYESTKVEETSIHEKIAGVGQRY